MFSSRNNTPEESLYYDYIEYMMTMLIVTICSALVPTITPSKQTTFWIVF